MFPSHDPDRRRINDFQLMMYDKLVEQNKIDKIFNNYLFQKGDSRNPELAGIGGALVGSFFTIIITLLLSFPIAIFASIYLEEFAPKNRITDFIEININNLAAVPSIVFGLLGLGILLGTFDLPRSTPLVAGITLALMTLPRIIIPCRASLKAVPPSIREGALAVGASKVQSVMHHVVPLAIPGTLSGTIIGLAQALGETAPLILIGMVAFVVDIPSIPTFVQPDLSGFVRQEDIPTFDPTGLQEQITALQQRPNFDPTSIQQDISQLQTRPQFDPTGLQEQIGLLQQDIGQITPFNPTSLQQQIGS